MLKLKVSETKSYWNTFNDWNKRSLMQKNGKKKIQFLRINYVKNNFKKER